MVAVVPGGGLDERGERFAGEEGRAVERSVDGDRVEQGEVELAGPETPDELGGGKVDERDLPFGIACVQQPQERLNPLQR